MNKISYPIRVVAERTGLGVDLIRMWERRYQAVTPRRSSSGHRSYSDSDILRLGLLRDAVACGWRIGEVSGYENDELRSMVAKHNLEKSPARIRTPKVSPSGKGDADYLQLSLEAVDAMDSVALERLLSEAEMEYGMSNFFDELLVPLLKEIGHRWADGRVRIGQEHLLSATLRHYLDNARMRGNISGEGPTILVTTPLGQNHELGALMCAATAASAGWKTVYINPNNPATEIAWAAKEVGAKVVALSIVYPGDDARLEVEIRGLRRVLSPETPILIGGSAAEGYSLDWEEIVGIEYIAGQRALRERLNVLRLGRRSTD